jgi:hypothetical protein
MKKREFINICKDIHLFLNINLSESIINTPSADLYFDNDKLIGVRLVTGFGWKYQEDTRLIDVSSFNSLSWWQKIVVCRYIGN